MPLKEPSCFPEDPGRFLNDWQLRKLGLGFCGRDVQIDRDAQFIFPEHIHVGDRTRIDAGVIISAGPQGVYLDYNVHLGANSLIFGGGGRVEIAAFSGFSSQVRCYTATDDYLSNCLSGPTVPAEFKNVQYGDVILGRCVMVGSGCLLLPNVHLREGCVCCAHTVVTRSRDPGEIILGHPARVIGCRDLDVLRELRKGYLTSIGAAWDEQERDEATDTDHV